MKIKIKDFIPKLIMLNQGEKLEEEIIMKITKIEGEIMKQEIIDNLVKEIKEKIKKRIKLKILYRFHKKEKFIKKIWLVDEKKIIKIQMQLIQVLIIKILI